MQAPDSAREPLNLLVICSSDEVLGSYRFAERELPHRCDHVQLQMMTSPWSRLRAMAAPEWIYRDAEYLVVDLDLDPIAARHWVPRPLRLASPARATLFTARFPTTTFGSTYLEAGLFLHVTHRRMPSVYSPWMIVDDDVALIIGRELLGYPKKLGEITWRHEEDRIRTTAHRRGHELLVMEGEIRGRVTSPPPIIGQPHRNVRAMAGFALPKVIAFTPRERIVDVRHVDVELRVGGSERDPLHSFGLGRVMAARLHRVDIGGHRLPLPVALACSVLHARHVLLRSH